MTRPQQWRPTAATSRAAVIATTGTVAAVLAGRPTLLVLVAPLLVAAALALAGRPRRTPSVGTDFDHHALHEGQGTTSRLVLADAEDVEQVTRVASPEPFLAVRPAGGRVTGLLAAGPVDLEFSPQRWGRRVVGEEAVALTSPWAGFRWGPTTIIGDQVRVLPIGLHYASHAESPQPRGLVGAHRSSRPGSGTEFAGIRAFVPGDRLRRINWRVSARTDQLHVTTTRAEEDAGVLLVVDAIADHGRSGGVDGAESSLDLTVRAAAAVAEHATRQGDRVSLRVLGRSLSQVGYGSGQRHLRRVLGTLASIQPGSAHDGELERLQLRATEGTMVVVLSPMLTEVVATLTATAVRRGLPTLVVDTMPEDAEAGLDPAADPLLADLAWRMRRLEREQVLASLATLGCPVVPWRGPGTIDEVTHRLARRARQPHLGMR
ncbi:hypothetical protein NPS01_24430 [Nocardioides psychrotolerans]|uniref:Uncharacterized conserved protein, DUF58 family, contains vWF domain n=1 Tax=Nocardioides psychrotolerans TaxID=1005945 RepID=A0A1I3L8F4_9ACTN|nr:DUF58 domain-containing protein [Nocardioides psychrotolerans]GEP38780.1 hypothetical protein NPS01_24430 [Nocardioides psychrotolerans]SFI80987.1 Uncharacterized conserved protein, DUF58 family, contains vWF domain [Nocardioides psychrotolerans]